MAAQILDLFSGFCGLIHCRDSGSSSTEWVALGRAVQK